MTTIYKEDIKLKFEGGLNKRSLLTLGLLVSYSLEEILSGKWEEKERNSKKLEQENENTVERFNQLG